MCAGPAALGNPCTAPAQCESGQCTDGACCDVPACAADQSCNAPGHEGQCATPEGCPACVGDCNCNGTVTVNELITMVSIALEDKGTVRCVAGDANGDGHITVDEIVTAVNNALVGCPGSGGAIARRAAGTTVGLSQGLRALPLMLSSITQLAGGGAAAAEFGDGGTAAVQACSVDGTRDFQCTQTIPTTSPRSYTLGFNNCILNTAGGGTLTLQGTITAQSTETGVCGLPPLALSTLTVDNVHVIGKNAAAVTTLDAQFNNLTGSLTVTPNPLSACKVSSITMMVNGMVDIQSGSLSEMLTFTNTSIKVDVTQFSQSCVPVVYQMMLDGNASLDVNSLGTVLSGMFTDFVFGDDTTSGNDLVTVDGQLSSTCLGTTIMFSTPTALTIQPGMVCPTAGAVLVGSDLLKYTASGGIDIDLGNNLSVDQMITTCLDAQLYMCPSGVTAGRNGTTLFRAAR